MYRWIDGVNDEPGSFGTTLYPSCLLRNAVSCWESFRSSRQLNGKKGRKEITNENHISYIRCIRCIELTTQISMKLNGLTKGLSRVYELFKPLDLTLYRRLYRRTLNGWWACVENMELVFCHCIPNFVLSYLLLIGCIERNSFHNFLWTRRAVNWMSNCAAEASM